MTNLKVINPNQSVDDDPDVFIRMCNDAYQERRRAERREADRKRYERQRNLEYLICAAAGSIVTFIAMILPILF